MATGIVRRDESWSWQHIKEHRGKIRQYKAKYKEKLQLKKTPQVSGWLITLLLLAAGTSCKWFLFEVPCEFASSVSASKGQASSR